MFSFCRPELSSDEQSFMVSIQEEIVTELGLHYRVVDVAARALGAAAARKYDIEVWLPGQERFREVMSCSNCTDYQSRRLGARMGGKGTKRLLHTVNGTAVAMGRMIIAIMENFQGRDGRVTVPPVLRPYLPMNSQEVLGS